MTKKEKQRINGRIMNKILIHCYIDIQICLKYNYDSRKTFCFSWHLNEHLPIDNLHFQIFI